jgi:2-polyprenyl-3-methyl-5-hydroxy-6-metoxy-1,4-benzoquinol methylase
LRPAEPSAFATAGTWCLVCGPGESAVFLFHTLRPILKCPRCGLVFAQPDARHSDASRYDQTYYQGLVYADYLGDRAAIHRNARRTLGELEALTAGRSLLDAGCATGFFLEAARARGWRVRGLEVSEYASDYARRQLGLPVLTASIVSPPADLGGFDVITMWDIIEHLDRPDLALRNVRRMLGPGGLVVISTGDYASWLRRLTGRRWRLFSDATHNFFFTERTLAKLLADAGLRVVRVSRRGKWVSLAMMLHQSPLPLRKTVGAWIERSGWQPFVYLNPRDVMTLIATPDGGIPTS